MNKIQEILQEAKSAPSFRQNFTKWCLIILAILTSTLLIMNYLYYRKMNENRYDKIIEAVAESHNLDPFIIKAIIKRESKFNPNARGKDGEIGLMQIIPNKAFKDWKLRYKERHLSAQSLYDPAVNIEVGSWYFAKQAKQWKAKKSPYAFGLAAYNAGPGHFKNWIEKSPNTENINEIVRFPMTKDYVNSILTYYSEYKKEAEEQAKAQP